MSGSVAPPFHSSPTDIYADALHGSVDSHLSKFLLRGVGHLLFKKGLLEINWQLVLYLYKLGFIDDMRCAFLVNSASLVYVTMAGRMLQASSEDVLLMILLELAAVLTEMMEAMDLLKLHTPLVKLNNQVTSARRIVEKSARRIVETSARRIVDQGVDQSRRLMRSTPQVVPSADEVAEEIEDSNITQGVVVESDIGTETLRKEYCSHTLIVSQIAEVINSTEVLPLSSLLPPLTSLLPPLPPHRVCQYLWRRRPYWL